MVETSGKQVVFQPNTYMWVSMAKFSKYHSILRTILKYHSRYLCQISPCHESTEARKAPWIHQSNARKLITRAFKISDLYFDMKRQNEYVRPGPYRIIVATFNEDGLSLKKKQDWHSPECARDLLEHIGVHFCTSVHSHAVHFIVQLSTL